jgi:hypothetical protein
MRWLLPLCLIEFVVVGFLSVAVIAYAEWNTRRIIIEKYGDYHLTGQGK